MKIIFISDVFEDQHVGGAEINDGNLIKFFKSKDWLTGKINSQNVTPSFLLENQDNIFVVSNFAGLSAVSKAFLYDSCTYFIYEHDYKFAKSRNPIWYPDFIVPKNHKININFYKGAKKLVCLSNLHREIYEKNIPDLKNIVNITCSLFSDEKIDYLLSLSKDKKTKKYAIIDSADPRKRTADAVAFCKKNNYDYDLIKSDSNDEFLKMMSQYENLVYMAGHPEPTPRIAVEAKLLGVKLISQKNLIGVAHEEWYSLEGEKLANALKKIREDAFKMFESFFKECEVPNEA